MASFVITVVCLPHKLIIDQRPVEQTAHRREIKDNGYKSIFTSSWLVHVRQRNRSWIKGLGKNPQEWNRSLLAVPFVRGYWTVTPMVSKKRLRVYKSSITMGMPCMACWQGNQTHKSESACVDDDDACVDVVKLASTPMMDTHDTEFVNWLLTPHLFKDVSRSLVSKHTDFEIILLTVKQWFNRTPQIIVLSFFH